MESASAAVGAELPEGAAYTPAFVRRRLLVFLGIVIGYSSYYLTRNSLTYTAPVMVADHALGMDITQVRVQQATVRKQINKPNMLTCLFRLSCHVMACVRV